MNKIVTYISIFVFFVSNLNAMELSGTVISDNEKIITSRYMGFIKDVYVKEGDFVKKGEKLFTIESSNIDSKKEELELSLQIQRNNYNNIKINYERYKRLYKKDLVPKYDVEQLELNLLNVKSMMNILQAKLKDLQYQYNYLKIVAPNNGLIIKKSIKSGEIFVPGSVAVVISDLDSLNIIITIAESDLKDIKVGKIVDISIASIGLITKGKIVSIIPHLQNVTHSFEAKISFDKKDKTVYPGMYSKVNLNLENK